MAKQAMSSENKCNRHIHSFLHGSEMGNVNGNLSVAGGRVNLRGNPALTYRTRMTGSRSEELRGIAVKQGILLTAFGSGSVQGETSFRRFDALVRERFPGIPVRWAFTSMLMRERLASARKKSDSVSKALTRMAFERFTHVAVQPLQLIAGFEYGDIRSVVRQMQEEGLFAALSVGKPLLDENSADAVRVAEALLAGLPEERCPDEAVLFMGHGSRHASERQYEILSRIIHERDSLVFMGTLNGTVRLESLLPRLLGARRVWLLPLLAVVGRHTLEDMAGAAETSWYSRLTACGVPCTPVLKGMTEYAGLLDIWGDHLAFAMRDWPSSP